MAKLRIALLQLTASGDDVAANLDKGLAACRRAASTGADVALFPEMWSHGYHIPDASDEATVLAWQSSAIGDGDEFLVRFRDLADELGMAIAVTYLERRPGAPRNSMTLIDRHGETVFSYAKVHTCDFDLEALLERGDDFQVGSLDTAAGPVEVGAMICYDREFPESARILMLKGAEVILTPNACGLDENRLGQFRARAYENMVACAMANYPAPQNDGHSVVFDGIGYGPDETPLDPTLLLAGEAEGIHIAELDLDRLREYRRSGTWGNAFRRPDRYGILAAPEVLPPFVRSQARR